MGPRTPMQPRYMFGGASGGTFRGPTCNQGLAFSSARTCWSRSRREEEGEMRKEAESRGENQRVSIRRPCREQPWRVLPDAMMHFRSKTGVTGDNTQARNELRLSMVIVHILNSSQPNCLPCHQTGIHLDSRAALEMSPPDLVNASPCC